MYVLEHCMTILSSLVVVKLGYTVYYYIHSIMNVTILWAQFIKSSPLSNQFLYDIYFTIGLLRSSAPLHVATCTCTCIIIIVLEQVLSDV